VQVGIFTHYFPYAVAEAARRIRAHGFETVQLVPSNAEDAAWCRHIRDVFAGEGLVIAALAGYVNLIAPDPDRRRQASDRLRALLRQSLSLGSPLVVTETGTRHPDDDWAPHPDNDRREVYEQLVESVAEMAAFAREHGAALLLEPSVGNVVDTPQKAARLLRDVASPALGMVADPANYVDGGNLEQGDALMDALFAELAPAIRLAHAKDVRRFDGVARERHFHAGDPALYGGAEYPAAGLGDMDYDRYIALLRRHCPGVPLILEHLDEADVPRAKSFIDRKLGNAPNGKTLAP
jgi:sugar phosphate isomerase/epimerase